MNEFKYLSTAIRETLNTLALAGDNCLTPDCSGGNTGDMGTALPCLVKKWIT